MKIKQPVINTFKRVGFPYETYEAFENTKTEVSNWLSGETVETTPLIRDLVEWVYRTQMDFERGVQKVNVSDFDRIRYFILEVDPKVYSTCID